MIQCPTNKGTALPNIASVLFSVSASASLQRLPRADPDTGQKSRFSQQNQLPRIGTKSNGTYHKGAL